MPVSSKSLVMSHAVWGVSSMVLGLALGLVGCASAPVRAAPAELTAEGRRWTDAFYAGETQAMWDHLSPRMQRLFGEKKRLDEFRDEVVARRGREVSVVAEREEVVRHAPSYIRVARFEGMTLSTRTALAVDERGVITLFIVEPTLEGLLGGAPARQGS